MLSTTQSSNAETTAAVVDRVLNGASDFYPAKFALDGTLSWASFVGGSDCEGTETHNLAVRGDNTLEIAGGSRSTVPILADRRPRTRKAPAPRAQRDAARLGRARHAIVPASHAERFASGISGGTQTRILAGAEHSVDFDALAQLAAAIEEFLGG